MVERTGGTPEVQRTDHISRILGQKGFTEQEQAQAKAGEGEGPPAIPAGLVEYLEGFLQPSLNALDDANSVDGLIALGTSAARIKGARILIEHLRSIQQQQAADRSSR